MSYKGIDIRSGTTIIFRASLKDATGAILTTGTTTLMIVEVQSDGSYKTYDFNDNTFKTTACTTPTVNMTHRQANNNTVNTGVWNYVLSTLTGFTTSGIYKSFITNTGAMPAQQEREFQYGGNQEDISTFATATTLGTPAGASIAADIAAVKSDTGDLTSRISSAVGTALTKLAGAAIAGTETAGSLLRLFYDRVTGAVALDSTVAKSATALVNTTWTDAKAAHIDEDISSRASQTSVTAITTNTARGRSVVPDQVQRPLAGSTTFEFDLNIYSLKGQLEAPDAAPAVHARDAAGNSLDSMLGSTTMTLISTGRYKVTFTVPYTATLLEALFDFSWVVGGVSFNVTDYCNIVDAYAVDFTGDDRTKLTAIHDKLPSGNIGDATDAHVLAIPTNPLTDKTGFSLAATERVKLASSQPDYAPTKAGDAMTASNMVDISGLALEENATTNAESIISAVNANQTKIDEILQGLGIQIGGIDHADSKSQMTINIPYLVEDFTGLFLMFLLNDSVSNSGVSRRILAGEIVSSFEGHFYDIILESDLPELPSMGDGICIIPIIPDNQKISLTATEENATANQSEILEAISAIPTVVLPAIQGEAYTAVAVQQRVITIVRGDSPRITFDCGADYNDWTAWFGAKVKATDTAYLISPKQCTWSNASLGQGYVELSATENATACNKGLAEIELRNGAQRLTVLRFALTIIEDVID